ncbi:MAG: fluoride efflux transporter CrcB [Saprospiraceae bacterium]
MAWIYVFIGGGTGSILRYILAQRYNSVGQELVTFPLGTFLANIISCFILGILIQKQIADHIDENYRLLLAIGFCGGFSTFSTFGYELYMYMQKGQLYAGTGYVLLSIIGGIIVIILGIKLHSWLY